MGPNTATVETLTAEVHVLKMGSRQVTNGVFRQLDSVPVEFIEPFGRVHSEGGRTLPNIRIIGRDNRNGALVKAEIGLPDWLHGASGGRGFEIYSTEFCHLSFHSPNVRESGFRRVWNGTPFRAVSGNEGHCPEACWSLMANDGRAYSCDLDALEALALEECNALVDAAIPAVETYQWAEGLPLIVLASR